MRTCRRTWAWLVLACGACGACGACRDVTPPEIARSTPLAIQAPYALWWAATEACAGTRGDFAAVRWAVVADSTELAADGHTGSWYAPTNQITLAGNHILDGPLVRHEMLHALLGARYTGQHPPEYFRGRCDGVVVCGTCAAEPAVPPVAPGTPPLVPADLRAHVEVTPAAFPRDSNGGWVLITVSVQNPRPLSAVVQLDHVPGVDAAQTFGARFEGEGRLLLPDGVTLRFGPGQTRRYVFDVNTSGYAPGPHTAYGTFNTAPGDSAVVTIRP